MKLQVKYILSFEDVADRIESLNSLPTEVFDAYQRLFDRLSEPNQKLALKIFSWILYAKRPLTIDEIREAIAIRDGSRDLPEQLNDKQTIVECCQGLTDTVDYDVMTFVHETVRDFLRERYGNELQKASIDVVKFCITYLGFDVFNEVCANEIDIKKRVAKYKFGLYTARYWGNHLRDVGKEIDIINLVLEKFQSAGKRRSMLQLSHYPQQVLQQNAPSSRWSYDMPCMSLLHILIREKLASVLIRPLSDATCDPRKR